ncbi:MAG: DNA repair protein RecO [Lachnospiraceae bacterium]|nr:DNA repair protein RecO [Lachnospiraceae bacterium]
MSERIFVRGMVLLSQTAGETDKRVTLFTIEQGKVNAFARGARRVTSSLSAATEPFSFGTFSLVAGKSSYYLTDAQIDNYFEELRTDLDAACYGMFFLELADYYTRENNEDKMLLKLLYQSLRALSASSIDKRLVRIIFELKALMVEGEYPGLDMEPQELDAATVYSVHFIETAPIEKLYTFTVSDTVLEELDRFCVRLRRRFIDRPLKSLQMLETVEA